MEGGESRGIDAVAQEFNEEPETVARALGARERRVAARIVESMVLLVCRMLKWQWDRYEQDFQLTTSDINISGAGWVLIVETKYQCITSMLHVTSLLSFSHSNVNLTMLLAPAVDQMSGHEP